MGAGLVLALGVLPSRRGRRISEPREGVAIAALRGVARLRVSAPIDAGPLRVP